MIRLFWFIILFQTEPFSIGIVIYQEKRAGIVQIAFYYDFFELVWKKYTSSFPLKH